MSDTQLIEPSDSGRAEWPQATSEYVWALERELAAAEARADEAEKLSGEYASALNAMRDEKEKAEALALRGGKPSRSRFVMWSKRLRRFAVPLQRLVRRFTIRKPCWVCDKCGWRERHEAEVWCWKCGKRLGGQMIYTPNTSRQATLAAADKVSLKAVVRGFN